MDFPLNSSLILALTVGLWLLWVGPYFLRPLGAAAGSTVIRSSISADGLSHQQGNIMHSTSSAAQSGSRPPAPAPAAATPAFRIRYGRTALALAGVLALLTVAVGTPLSLFGAASWWVPAGALATAGAVVAALRLLAVRDRHRRVNAAFRAAMGSGRSRQPRTAPGAAGPRAAGTNVAGPKVTGTNVTGSGVPGSGAAGTPGGGSGPAPHAEVPASADGPSGLPPAVQRETVLFDNESPLGPPAGETTPAAQITVSVAPGTEDSRPTAEELRTAALAVAAQSAPAQPAGPPPTSTTPWEPVEVPKPTYVEAPVAQRPAPEPLVLPEEPKPAGKASIRAGAAAAAASAGTQTAGTQAGEPTPSTGKINLDDVLQRRRA